MDLKHRRPAFAWAFAAAAVMLAVLAGAPRARADEATGAGAPPGFVQLTGMRAWTNPGGTRLVFDFSAEVTPVAPDSGVGPQLMVTVPAPGITAATGVPTSLTVDDTVVVKVESLFEASGVRFWIQFAPGVTFKVYTLAPADGLPFRVVVEAMQPGAQAAEDKRLAGIAAAKKKNRVRLVVVDPGHGGEDRGARGLGPVYEKNITLSIARRLV